MIRFLSFFLLLVLGTVSNAQIITPNESAVVVQSPKKIGINLNGPANYGSAEFYKNLIWQNPGFEPGLYRDKFVAPANGTTTTFTAPSPYDPVVSNFWTGATFGIYRGDPKAQVCSGTIAGNTTATSTTGPTYTFSSACSSPVVAGDVIVLRKSIACTPEADWESSHAGWPANISGGGQLTSECATPYDGTQSLRMDASASGSKAGVLAYIDSAAWQTGILLDGQYTISGYYKTIGNPTFSVSAQRNSSGAGNPFSCATKTFAASPAWTAFSSVCTGNETNDLPVSTITLNFTAQNGVVELDDVAFQRTSGNDPTNTTVFRDELLATLRAHCAGGSLTNVPCELRDWAGQNADEIDNTIKPLFKRSPVISGFNYDYAGGQGRPVIAVSLEEFLELCQAIGAEPYYALPETTDSIDAPRWIEYLNGAASTPYGAKRSANGQSASWLTIFPTIHLAMGNENWNVGETGEGLGYRSGAPDLYYDYSTDAAGIWGAMRASSSWPSGGNGFDLILGFQTGNANNGITEAMTRTSANSGELAPYTQAYIGDTSSLTALWNPLFYEVVANTTNSATIFDQQGKAIKNYGKLNVYEFDNGTSQGPSNLTQSVLDSFTDAAGYGTATALQGLQHLNFGVVDQNFFSLPQYYVPGPNGTVVHHWGAVVDMGGATNAVRPQELGMRMANTAIIGPMYTCPVASPTTSNLGSNHNGYDSNGTPASNNIPQEYSFCFMSGTQRSMVVINTDVVNSHAVSFSGAGSPSGNVTVTRYAPASISATNEATGTLPTNTAARNVAISAPFIIAYPSGDTLPPYSISRYDWVKGSNASATGTTTNLSISNSAPTLGSSVTLAASVTSSSATGWITFLDGTTALGSVMLGSGTSSFTVSAIGAGNHSYTASYGGDNTHAGSMSSAVQLFVAGPYIRTVFNEYGSGHSLDGTAPAIDVKGSTWTDQNGDWFFGSAGGVMAGGPDLTNPTLIDATQANYVATFTYPASGAQLLFRYVDLNNYVYVMTYPGEIDLNSRVDGVNTTIGTIYLSNTAAQLTVTLNGSTGTITCGGQTASGTIPSSLLTGTSLGFFPRSRNFIVSSLDVSPIASRSLTATSVALSTSNTAPTAGASITLTATITPAAATGTVAFFDGNTALASAQISGASAAYTANSVSAGPHSFTAVYSGDSSYATSTSSAVSITASSAPASPFTASTTTVAPSNTTPTAGSTLTLTASVSPSAASGMVTLADGSTTLGTGTLSNGSAAFTIGSVSAGTHSYVAAYGGNSSYAASTSPAVVVAASTSGSSTTYIHTNFNEFASSHTLDKTSPAVNTVNATWIDPNDDWSFGSAGGVVAGGPDLTNPTLIDATQTNYVATFTYPASGAQLLFRYVDLNNYVYVFTYPGEIDLYSRIGGVNTTIGTIYPSSTAAQLTVTLNGSTGTITCGGQTASGTIPSSLLAGTRLGFFPRSKGFFISSLDVSSIAGGVTTTTATTTSLSVSNITPTAGTSITVLASIAPSVSQGIATLMDGSSVLSSTTASGGSATFIVALIASGSHSYQIVYNGSANYAKSTSPIVVVTAASSGSPSTAYLHTTFNELPASQALGGTASAIDAVGSKWSDPNGDWRYVTGGGVSSAGPDLLNPALIDATHANYTATFTYPTSGAHLLFRYIDVNNYIFAYTYPGEIDLYSQVAGSSTILATIYPSNTAAPLTVTLNGATGTISCGGQTASGTIPSTLLNGTTVGFFPRSAGFVISSLDVSP